MNSEQLETNTPLLFISEIPDEEALSWLKRNTILDRREFIINSSNKKHLKFYWNKIKCILAGAVAGASALSLLGAAAVYAGDKEKVKLLFKTGAIIPVSRSFRSIKKKPIFCIAVICYAAITGNPMLLWGAGIGLVIGVIVGGYYGAKENEPREAFKNVDRKVSDFISKTAAEIVNFVKTCRAPEEAEQSPETV
ncbi:hypothetical protein HHUSO_G29347 [Huso huso]|uniref:Uncharacterized protein n=1 Tax=Huso huso TaxID=61971 RepID=A0ABR0YFT3_HUSHU